MPPKKHIHQIASLLRDLSHDWTYEEVLATPLISQIEAKISANEELLFILPAFPAKSPSPEKTSGKLPDFAEVVALKRLNNFCAQVSDIYEGGARIVICSDGRAFGDIVHVTDEVIDEYNEGIIDIINEFSLGHLSVFTMEDLYPELSADQLRELLLSKYARSLEEVRGLIKEDQNYQTLFNGIHRFLIEDEKALFEDLSRNQLCKRSKLRTYELIRRSDSWGELLNCHFKDALRFSIHPYPVGHPKFGVKLVSSSSRWATPWHNVAVKIKERIELMHLSEAMKLGATRKLFEDRYAYFEIAAI